MKPSVAAHDVGALARTLRYAESRSEVFEAHYALVAAGAVAVAPLIGILCDERSPRVQRAWWTLSRLGEAAVGPLVECLAHAAAAETRAAAGWLLGRSGASDVSRHLVRALEDPSPVVQLPVVLMLGYRRCREAVPNLVRMLEADFDDPSAPHCDQLSFDLPGLHLYGEVGADDAPPARRCSEAKAQSARGRAIFTGAVAGLPDDFGSIAVEAVAEAWRQGDDTPLEVWTDPDEATPEWVASPWCHWDTASLLEAVAYALGLIGDRRSVPTLMRLVDDDDREMGVRRAAIEALGMIADARAYDVLAGAFGDDALSDEALAALARLRDQRALSLLKQAANDSGVGRLVAVGGLAEAGDGAALPHLVELAEADDVLSVNEAIRGLALLGTQAALEALLGLLTHRRPELRRAAAAALRWADESRSQASGRGGSLFHP